MEVLLLLLLATSAMISSASASSPPSTSNSSTLSSNSHNADKAAGDVEGGRRKRPDQDMMKLVFYMHDLPAGRKPTGVVVAGNLTTFGLGTTLVFDDPLTDGPGRGSNPVGAGQGLYSLASSTYAVDLLLVFTAVFREPHPFAGSTLAFLGSDRTALPKREVAVVGGTGRFRFARGFAIIETVSIKPPNAILKFDVTLRLH